MVTNASFKLEKKKLYILIQSVDKISLFSFEDSHFTII